MGRKSKKKTYKKKSSARRAARRKGKGWTYYKVKGGYHLRKRKK